ncbi:hypothetical protein EHP00_1010 [Ecytonucleospora hepatopenaei]|uniref:Uncharacterized protein n=1 Tax=Ecytonucleospora hepatopenaei TaxID=646526 RepID=A0A1W0E651_9MICR|nr:hypothetical protein EHP00_1010 [Ecytonucleospora hepatopenaei]
MLYFVLLIIQCTFLDVHDKAILENSKRRSNPVLAPKIKSLYDNIDKERKLFNKKISKEVKHEDTPKLTKPETKKRINAKNTNKNESIDTNTFKWIATGVIIAFVAFIIIFSIIIKCTK